MALWAPIYVNSEKIGTIYVQRLEAVPADGVSRYKAEVHINGTRHDAELKHRYADGALVLFHKVLGEVLSAEGEGE